MRAVIQKVTRAMVDVGDETVGEIADGFVMLLGITHGDTQKEADWLIEKVLKLRLFAEPGSETFMEHNIVDQGGGILLISQFTLYGDCKKGTRPSFSNAAKPDVARPLYEYVAREFIARGVHTQTGVFGEKMEVMLVNDGPVTLVIDTEG